MEIESWSFAVDATADSAAADDDDDVAATAFICFI